MTALFWTISGLTAALLGVWLMGPVRQYGDTARDKRAALGVLAGVPLSALLVYLYLGNPNLPDAPLAPRLQGQLDALPPGAVLARLENQLRARPDDVRGWRLLARLHATTGNHPKAADSWQRVLDLTGRDIEAMTGLAQALIEQEGGVVGEAAAALLDNVLAEEPSHMKALFWRAEAWAQQDRLDEARVLWQRLRAALPNEAPLAKMLDKRLN